MRKERERGGWGEGISRRMGTTIHPHEDICGRLCHPTNEIGAWG
jgi:hypothetical protein